MKNQLKNKMVAFVIAILLVVGMCPAVYAARTRDRGKITLEKFNVKLVVGASVTLTVTYDGVEDKDIFRSRVSSDKPDIAEVNFGFEGSDASSIVITGLADGATTVYVSAGGVSGTCNVTVGRGDKSPEQIKKEEAAAKAEQDMISNDKSELGAALAEAIKKASEKTKEVVISTTTAKTPAIPVATIKALAARAKQAKKYAIVRIDSVGSDGKIQAQMLVNPEGLTGLKSEFKTGVTVDTSRKASLGSNYIASVKCAQTGSFLMYTEIAVKVNAPKDVSKLSIYNVDSKGKLVKIEEPSCSVDSNGLLRFFTKYGGEIVIMSGKTE